jgi:hypothetical protein
VLRVLFATVRSRIAWVMISAATVADAAFVFTVALAAAAIAVRGQDVDPDELAAVATSLAFLAAVLVIATVVAVKRAARRTQARRWLPVYEAMAHDATHTEDTYLVKTVTQSHSVVGGHMVAADVNTGRRSAVVPVLVPSSWRGGTLHARWARGCWLG